MAILLTLSMLLIGCGSPTTSSTGEYCPTYGFLNESNKKCESMNYDLSVGNLIWGVILIETVIAPVYFFGFSLYEPVTNKNKKEKKQ